MTYTQDVKIGKGVYRYKVTSYRDGGKVKQHREYLGKVTIDKGKERVVKIHNTQFLSGAREVRSCGLLSVLYKIAEEWNISKSAEQISPIANRNKYGNAILLLAFNHITERCALDRVSQWYRRSTLYPLLGSEDEFTKDKLLSAMDSLVYEDEHGNIFDFTQEFTKALYETSKTLVERSNSGLIYDITEVASYSEHNPYAALGYSPVNENNKMAKVCLVTERDTRLPVSIFINNGKINDKSTVREMLNTLLNARLNCKGSYLIEDRGMASEDNIALHKGLGLDLIVGLTSRRNDVKELVSSVPEKEFLHPTNAIKRSHEGISYIVERKFDLGGTGGKAIVCLVPDLQNNQRASRISEIKSALDVIDRRNAKRWNKTPREKIGSITDSILGSVKKFVKIKVDRAAKKVNYELDDEELEKAINMDGRFAIFSTDKNLNKYEMFDAYFSRDEIEKVFETYKGYLDLPPIRHWKRRRIMCYMQICFLAYVIQSYLMYKIRKAGLDIGWTDLKFSLCQIQEVVYGYEKDERKQLVNLAPQYKIILEKIGYPIV